MHIPYMELIETNISLSHRIAALCLRGNAMIGANFLIWGEDYIFLMPFYFGESWCSIFTRTLFSDGLFLENSFDPCPLASWIFVTPRNSMGGVQHFMARQHYSGTLCLFLQAMSVLVHMQRLAHKLGSKRKWFHGGRFRVRSSVPLVSRRQPTRANRNKTNGWQNIEKCSVHELAPVCCVVNLWWGGQPINWTDGLIKLYVCGRNFS
jgi:hypothetical protein